MPDARPAAPTRSPPSPLLARQRLAGLDGLRGLAALYVVVNHVFLRAFPGYPVDHAPFWAGWFIYGRFAVVVFIVLSGFSLALSPARHGWRLDAISRFAHRRARRILPAYWAALAFSLAVAWLIVPQPGHGVPDAKSVLVNGLLVQNIVGAPSPNAAFWSMAVEAQLYLLFPLLLLIVRRRGAIVMVATVTLIVAAVGIVGPHVARLDTFVIQSPPDLAALFAVGILTAGIVGAGSARRSWPWALARARRRGAGDRDDLVAGLGVDARPPVLGRPRARPGDRVPAGRLWPPAGRPRSLRAARRAADAQPRRVVLQPVPDPRPDPRRRLRADRRRPTSRQGVPAFLVSLALVLPLTIVFARVFASVFETPFSQQPQPVAGARAPAALERAGVPG